MRATTVLLPRSGRPSQVTPQELVRLEDRMEGVVPVYRCTESGAERAYGLLQPTTSDEELVDIFGPLRRVGGRFAGWLPAQAQQAQQERA
jgi:hypothetical protein